MRGGEGVLPTHSVRVGARTLCSLLAPRGRDHRTPASTESRGSISRAYAQGTYLGTRALHPPMQVLRGGWPRWDNRAPTHPSPASAVPAACAGCSSAVWAVQERSPSPPPHGRALYCTPHPPSEKGRRALHVTGASVCQVLRTGRAAERWPALATGGCRGTRCSTVARGVRM